MLKLILMLKVSTLYGLARVFNAEKYSMTVGGNFVKAWTLLLEYMENAASNKNAEVRLHSCSLICYYCYGFINSYRYH